MWDIARITETERIARHIEKAALPLLPQFHLGVGRIGNHDAIDREIIDVLARRERPERDAPHAFVVARERLGVVVPVALQRHRGGFWSRQAKSHATVGEYLGRNQRSS